MNIKIRRLISLVFLAIFLLITPMLLLYTAGYRYNFKKNSLQRTGTLVLATVPKGGQIYLNNEEAETKTPARLNNIIPDDYLVKIIKEGYYPYEKKLTVKSQETTFAEDITLFAKSEAEKIVEKNILWANFSPQKKFAVYQVNEFNQSYLYLLNLSSGRSKLIYTSAQLFTKPEVLWSDEESYLLFDSGNNQLILSTSLFERQISLKDKLAKNQVQSPRWSNDDDHTLFYQMENSVYKYDLLLNEKKLVYETNPEEKLLDFIVNQNQIFLITNKKQQILLNKDKLAGEFDSSKVIELNNVNFKLVKIINNYLILTNKQNNNFYLVNLDLDKILFQKNEIQSFDYQKEKSLLLLQTDQELSFIDLSKNLTENNITRYSQGLNKALWHKSSNYSLFLQEQNINIIELDDRNGHNLIKLPIDNIKDFSLDEKAKNLYFLKENSLWQLPLD